MYGVHKPEILTKPHTLTHTRTHRKRHVML